MKTILLALTSLLLFGLSSEVRACICYERQPPCVDYWQADAVFVGRVLQVSPDYKDDASYRVGRRAVVLALEQAFRGVTGEQVRLESEVSDCEYEFALGERYFVYAYRDKTTGALATSGCSRTTSYARAKDDLAFVEQLSRGAGELLISGMVIKDRYTPVQGLTVLARGEGSRHEAKTDTEGRFRIALPGAGKYTVRIILPKGYYVVGPAHQLNMITRYKEKQHIVSLEYYVEVQPNRCVFIVVPTYAEKREKSG